jgi:hypothetical protein
LSGGLVFFYQPRAVGGARWVVSPPADAPAWITGSTLTINGGQFMD